MENRIIVDYVAYRRLGKPGFEWWVIAADGSGRAWYLWFEFERLLNQEAIALIPGDLQMIIPDWEQCRLGPTYQRMGSSEASPRYLDEHWIKGTPPKPSELL